MSLSIDDVKKIYAGEVAKGKTSLEARQGTRTLVHGILLAETPVPYPLPPAKLVMVHHQPTQANLDKAKSDGVELISTFGLDDKSVDAVRKRDAAELVRRKVALATSVTPEHTKAFTEYNAGRPRADRATDPVHYAQKVHSTKLWEQGDALVVSALGGAS